MRVNAKEMKWIREAKQFFSFVVKTNFDTKHRYDQSGLDSAVEKMIFVLKIPLMV